MSAEIKALEERLRGGEWVWPSVTAAALAKLREERDELLDALKYVMSAHGEQLDDAFSAAHRAIAKAEGR